MSEAPAEQAPAAPEAQEQTTQQQSPPWGDDFNPEVAWEKIQKANREAEGLRKRVGPSEEERQKLGEYDRLIEASKSEQQRQQEALEAANQAQREAATEALRYRVAIDHGIGKEDLDLLGEGTEEQMVARAERIAALRGAQTPTPPPGRPQEALKPGATPSTEALSDEERLYHSIYGGQHQ